MFAVAVDAFVQALLKPSFIELAHPFSLGATTADLVRSLRPFAGKQVQELQESQGGGIPNPTRHLFHHLLTAFRRGWARSLGLYYHPHPTSALPNHP
jgi:hypothetical protein